MVILRLSHTEKKAISSPSFPCFLHLLLIIDLIRAVLQVFVVYLLLSIQSFLTLTFVVPSQSQPPKCQMQKILLTA